ncbi:MAG: site-specific integrase [Ignavibacteriales bacterium]|nr:site-specific integrase [Ignavibacteriales bacterium]MCF8437499.1 site-specific integrase [Ignavibacteriales bacterium]
MTISVKLKERPNQNGTTSIFIVWYYKKDFTKERKWELVGTLTGNKTKDRETRKYANKAIKDKEEQLRKRSLGLISDYKISIERCLKDCQAQQTKQRSSANYQSLEYHIKQFDPNYQSRIISAIDLSYVEKFLAYLQAQGLKSNSIRVYLGIFKSVMNFALRHDYITKSPFINLRLPKAEEPATNYLSINEKKILESFEPKRTALKAFLFACYTGLRYSDCKRLKFSDIKNGIIRTRMLKSPNFVEVPINSNQKAFTILEEQANNKIKSIEGLVFPDLPTNHAVNNHLKVVFRKTGIQINATFHIARHTFGTHLNEAETPAFTIKSMMGHQDIRTTSRYVSVSPATSERYIKKLNEL